MFATFYADPLAIELLVDAGADIETRTDRVRGVYYQHCLVRCALNNNESIGW